MNSMIDAELKNEVLHIAKELSKLNICPLTQGNISLRDSASDLIVITPHDYPYDIMGIEDLVVMDLQGNKIEGTREPSSEWAVHCVVYRHRDDVNGIVHSEPVYTNAFGAINKEILPIYINAAIDVKGSVPVMPFMDSGNAIFGEEMLKIMGDKNAVIWGSHGLLAVGATLYEAFHCTVNVEICAQMYHIALCHGEPYAIPQKKIDTLTKHSG